MKLVLIIMLLVIIQACSTRQIYNAVHSRDRFQCDGLPQAEQQNCQSRDRDGYEEYERKRNE